MNKTSQILFDLFDIEFQPVLLDKISLQILLLQSNYRQRVNSSFSVVLVSVMQSKLSNGKCFQDIKEFNSSLTQRRKFKLNFSRFRQKLQNISKETDSIEYNKALIKLEPGADKYFGIIEGSLSATLAPYVVQMNVKNVVKTFYSQYQTKEANLALLNTFNKFLTNIKPQYLDQIKLFAREKNFKWEDKESVETYMNKLGGCFEENPQKKQEESKKIEPKTELELAFIAFVKAVHADNKYWKVTTQPLNELISKSDEYKARFGSPVSFSESKISAAKNLVGLNDKKEDKIEQAKHLIKMFYLAKSLLLFNQKLYVYNAMMLKDMGTFRGDLNQDWVIKKLIISYIV